MDGLEDKAKAVVDSVLEMVPDFLLGSSVEHVKQGIRLSILKTATLNADLNTSASVDRLRLLLDAAMRKAGLRISGWTQSKFELTVDVEPVAVENRQAT